MSKLKKASGYRMGEGNIGMGKSKTLNRTPNHAVGEGGIFPMSYKNIILCDLDGTLANVGHRLPYLKNPDGTMKPQKERDWGSFHKACVDDAPYKDVIEIVSSVFNARQDNDLYILSGRNEVVREETEAWLCKHFPDYYELRMRKANDFRPDTEVKLDMVRELGFTPDNVLCIFDDRQCVVDMWRENGFRCLQVNAWEE